MTRAFGRYSRSLGCLAAAALTIGATAWAANKTAEARATGKQAEAKDAPQGNETLSRNEISMLAPRSAIDVGKEFLNRQTKGQMPWQFYQRYADVYFALKEKCLDTQTRGQDQTERIGVQAAYFEKLGKLVEEMAGQKHIIDDIKIKNTEIPAEQQPDALKQAEIQHDEALREFVTDLKNPPQASAARAKAAAQ